MVWADHVRDIRIDPDSDGPRLVAADWLLDKGDARGEHIVVSCQLAHLAPGTPEHAALAHRRRELEGLNSARWLEPVVQLGAQGAAIHESPLLTRGFVESVTLVGEHAASFAKICEHEPVINLTLESCSPSTYQTVATMPALDFVRHLTLQGDRVLGCEAVLESPHLTAVERLSLPNHGPRMLAALATGAARPYEHRMAEDVPSLTRLVAAQFFARVVYLEIRGLTDDGASVLGEATMPMLRWLELTDPQLTGRGMSALAPHLARVGALFYVGIPPSPDAIPVLIHALAVGKLAALRLGGFKCDPLAELIESPAFANIEKLTLLGAIFTPRIAEALQRTAYRDKLRSLRIRIGAGETPTGFTLDGVVIDDHDEPTDD